MFSRFRVFCVTLTLFALMLGASLAGAQEPTFGLSEEDRSLLGDAIVLSGEEDFFAFDYTFTLDMSGLPDLGTVSVDVSGEGVKAGSDIQLTMVGTGTVLDGPVPADLELRIIDGTLYLYVAELDLWRSLSESELNTLVGGQALPGGDAISMVEGFGEGISINPDEFITISRLPDSAINGVNNAHFQWNVNLIDLTNSTGFTSGLTALSSQPEIATQLSSAGIDSSQLAMVGMLFGLLFNDTTITLDQYVDPAEDRVSQAVFEFDMTLNPAMLGSTTTTTPLTIQATLTVNVSNYGVTQVVEVPEGAVAVTADELLNPAGMVVQPPADTGVVAAPTAAIAVPTVISAAPTAGSGGIDITSLANVTPAATASLPLFANPTPTPAGAVALPTGGSLTAGTPVVVQLTGAGPVDLAYSGAAGESVTISARSTSTPSVDTTVELLDLSGIRLGYNDDHGTTRTDLARFDSLISDVALPGAGTYTVRVNSFSGLGQGTVEVLLQSGGGNAVPPTPSASSGADVVTSVLEAGSSAEFPLTGTAGEVVTITVRALDNALDPRVALVSPAGTTLIENDDHRTTDQSLGRFDSRIADFSLPETGTYTMRVNGFGGSGGSFELTVERGGGSLPPAPTPTAGVSINVTGGQQVITGTVEQNGLFQHPLTVQPGNTYTFTVRGSGTFDPVLLIRDASGGLISGNDDHNSSDGSLGRFDSRVLNYVFQIAESVTVDIEEYDGEPGSFTLTIDRIDDSAPLGNGTEQVFTGQISANGTFSQTISAQAGDYVTIVVRGLTSDFDPVVALISPSGVLITDNDNHSSEQNIGDFDSFLRNVLITETGEHTIEVTGVRGSAGSFALTVRTLR